MLLSVDSVVFHGELVRWTSRFWDRAVLRQNVWKQVETSLGLVRSKTCWRIPNWKLENAHIKFVLCVSLSRPLSARLSHEITLEWISNKFDSFNKIWQQITVTLKWDENNLHFTYIREVIWLGNLQAILF